MSKDGSAKPPLQGHYWATVAFVLLALCPDLFVSTSFSMMQREITRSLHTSAATLALADTFSNAGWAFGAVLAADLAQHIPPRRLILIYEGYFIVSSAFATFAPSVWFVVGGHIGQGMATGMLLVAALPPLITSFPVRRLSSTVAVIAIGLFGGAAAGPLIGGVVTQANAWRELFAVTALLGVAAFIMGWLTVERKDALNPDVKLDPFGVALAALGAGLTFFGVGEIMNHPWRSPIVWLPTVLGFASIAALLILEYRSPNALMPVKPLSTTFPVIGVISAIVSGASFTSNLSLLLVFLERVRQLPPLAVGLLFWPTLVTAILASVLFGALLETRYVLTLPLIGMCALVVASVLLTRLTPATGDGFTLIITGLLGLGAGLTVSPGLFIAGLSVAPSLVGRAFALVEMLRLAGAFALVPAFLYLAERLGSSSSALLTGLHQVFWLMVGVMIATIAVTSIIFFVGGARLHPPDLSAYIERGEEALDSPPVTSNSAA